MGDALGSGVGALPVITVTVRELVAAALVVELLSVTVVPDTPVTTVLAPMLLVADTTAPTAIEFATDEEDRVTVAVLAPALTVVTTVWATV